MGNRHHEEEVMGGAHCANHTKAEIKAYNRSFEIHKQFCVQPEGGRCVCGVETRWELREYTSEERKGMPIDAGCLRYFPDALAAVARVSVAGNEKHNPGQPLHWSRGKSNDHAECVTRHRLTPDAIDPESGEAHRTHALWRLLADVQLAEEKRLLAIGIKPLSGVTE